MTRVLIGTFRWNPVTQEYDEVPPAPAPCSPATLHTLKTWPEYWREVAAGRKPFEVRKDDRGFKVGDLLHLQEFDPKTSTFTGGLIEAKITYILHGPNWGVGDGVAVLGIPKVVVISQPENAQGQPGAGK